ncbi:MAG: hypothetical protein V2A71_03440 [Candidatus Eisenbacteria bacterium]
MFRPQTMLRKFAVFLIGFSATSAQVVLLREFISAFHGNELVVGIFLSVWLLATAIGSGLVGRGLLGLARGPARGAGGDESADAGHESGRAVTEFAAVQAFGGLCLMYAVLGVLVPPPALKPAPGEVTGLAAAALTSLLFLLPLGVLQGLLFPLGARMVAQDGNRGASYSVSRVYLLEAVGAAAGGLLFSFLVRFVSSFQSIAALSALNFVTAGILFAVEGRRGLRVICTLLGSAAAVVCLADPVTYWAASRQWTGFEVLSVRQSRYGSLSVLSIDSQLSFYQDGRLLFSTDDVRSAEEAGHLPLLEHPDPRRVLLMGGGMSGVLGEILKHGSVARVDYVEPNFELIELGRGFLPRTQAAVLEDPRVRVILTDGRRFLLNARESYDVVFMQIPPPYTAQLNRFYTLEFFRVVRDHLRPGGVFVFSAPGVAEYVGDEWSAFLRSLIGTAQEVFAGCLIVPLEQSYVVCSRDGGSFQTAAPDSLLSRLDRRRIQTLFVRDYFLYARLSPERLQYLTERTARRGSEPLNTDLKPIGYYYDLILWSAEHERFMMRPLQWVFDNSWAVWIVVIAAAVAIASLSVARNTGATVLSALAVSGFAAIVLELEIILGFQLLYGSLYDRIGFLVTSYMAGLALGSIAERRRGPSVRGTLVRPAVVQFGTAGFAILFLAVEFGLKSVRVGFLLSALEWVFPLFAVCAGALGGALFTSCSRAFFGAGPQSATSSVNTGLTYAWDLVGSWVGAVFCSVLLFPVLGLTGTTVIIVVLLLASGAGLTRAAGRDALRD